MLGGERDFLPCRLTTINPSASVIELFVIGASVATDVTNLSMAKIRHASFSSKRATSKRVLSKKPVPPATRMSAVASIMRETFNVCRRANFDPIFFLDLQRSKGERENRFGVFEQQPTSQRSQRQGRMAQVQWSGNLCALQLWKTKEGPEEWALKLAKEVGFL